MSATLAGRRALVMGLGRFGGGVGAARFLAARGARVTVTDLRPRADLAESLAALADLPVEAALGEHRATDFERADLVVANPAVRADHPLLALARARGARVTSAIELFLEAVAPRGATVVGISGTQGKSSTCHFLGRLLGAAGRRVHLGGNLGGSLLTQLDEIDAGDVCVLELSSYQLEAMGAPPVRRLAAVGLTNVLADHLERHGSLAAYERAKLRLLEHLVPGGTSVLPAGDPRWPAPRRGERRLRLHAAPPPAPGDDDLFVAGGRFHRGERTLGEVADLRAPGAFQAENALHALGLASALGAGDEELAQGLRAVDGLPHRMEELGLVLGTRVVDNGVSTTPDSTRAALASLGRVDALLLGGQPKDLALGELRDEIARRVGAVVLFGALRDDWARQLAGAARLEACAGLAEAVSRGLSLAPAGGTLLFSPAAASFDGYANYLERARAFRSLLPGVTVPTGATVGEPA